MFKKTLTTKIIPLFLVGAVALAACAPATPTADTAATTQAMDAMHMQETETAMEAMHAQETQTAMEAMDAAHAQETQTAMDAMHMEETAQAQAEFKLSLTGLEDLGPGWAYEGWLIVDGKPVSSGVFLVDASGAPSATSFSVLASDLSAATTFVLTIEPSPDSDPAPSLAHVLAGDFNGETAELSVGHPAALGNDFAQATGGYILAAPSAGSGGSYTTGIWWLDPATGPGPSLNLPALPDGWVYEGWIVGANGPVSTGRFTSASEADSDGAGPTAGPDAAPPFPGQDFVNPAVNLIGTTVVISIEPEPDNSPAPFALKPLVDNAVDDSEALQAMENNAGSFPTGTVTR
jgi:hypothetical protein